MTFSNTISIHRSYSYTLHEVRKWEISLPAEQWRWCCLVLLIASWVFLLMIFCPWQDWFALPPTVSNITLKALFVLCNGQLEEFSMSWKMYDTIGVKSKEDLNMVKWSASVAHPTITDIYKISVWTTCEKRQEKPSEKDLRVFHLESSIFEL